MQIPHAARVCFVGPSLLLLTQCMPALAGAPAVPVDQRALLERLAAGDARTRLWTQIQQMPLTDPQTVGDVLADQPAPTRQLRLWLHELPTLRPAAVYTDATADAALRITPDELRDALQAALAAAATGPAVDPRQVRRAAASWRTLWGDGFAALPDRSESRKPLGWEDISLDGIERVRRAAGQDALAALLEQISRLAFADGQPLGAHLAAVGEGEARLRTMLAGPVRPDVRFLPEQIALAEVTLEPVTFLRLLSNLPRTAESPYGPAEFRQLAAQLDAAALTAVGVAWPTDAEVLQPAYREIELDRPDWTGRILRTEVALPAADANQGTAEQARLRGMLALRDQIMQLPVTDSVSVAAFLARRPALKPDVMTFLNTARVEQITASGASAAATVALPLKRLWLIVRRGLERIEVERPPQTVDTESSDQDRE